MDFWTWMKLMPGPGASLRLRPHMAAWHGVQQRLEVFESIAMNHADSEVDRKTEKQWKYEHDWTCISCMNIPSNLSFHFISSNRCSHILTHVNPTGIGTAQAPTTADLGSWAPGLQAQMAWYTGAGQRKRLIFVSWSIYIFWLNHTETNRTRNITQ